MTRIEESRVTTDKIVTELVAEFVEERVRQSPTKSFALADVTRALTAMLRDSDAVIDLKRVDDAWLSERLDEHPFLLKSKAGRTSQWKPGFNKQAMRRA
jgi:hypothetical protein